MLQEVVLPRLGQTVERATIEKWRVKEGDTVKRGDVLLEITTDKATLEVESFVDGTVLSIGAKPGDDVEIEAVIAYVGDPKTDKAPAFAPRGPGARGTGILPVNHGQDGRATRGTGILPVSEPTPRTGASPEPTAPPLPPGRLIISPRARKLAETEEVTPLAIRGTGPGGRIVEADVAAYADRVARLRVSPTARELAYVRGVDLLGVRGTGEDGRIMKSDVESARPLTQPAAHKAEMTPARRIIAERMARSKREAPHFYLQVDIDMTDAVAFRQELAAAGTKVSFNDLLIRAVALGFQAVPAMNAGWSGDAIVFHPAADVSLAVALDGNLLVPVVRGVDRLSLEQIAARTADLIDRARNHRLAPLDYEGGGITISNLGMYGVGNFIPILNPGQASILGVGAIADRPVAWHGGIALRKMMGVTLSIDHRIADGALAAEFLRTIKQSLEAPREQLP